MKNDFEFDFAAALYNGWKNNSLSDLFVTKRDGTINARFCDMREHELPRTEIFPREILQSLAFKKSSHDSPHRRTFGNES